GPAARRCSMRATSRSSAHTSIEFGASWKSMSAVERDAIEPAASPRAAAEPSPLYSAWLRRLGLHRRPHIGTQLALLALFLLAWEVFPRLHVLNPMLTSYPSAIGPTFVSLVGSAGNEGNILYHSWLTLLR